MSWSTQGQEKGQDSVSTICLQGYAHLHVREAFLCEGSGSCLQLVSLLWKCGQAPAGGG